MNNLEGAIVYLAGPIDRAPDLGITWRNQFKQLSKDNRLGLKIIDPCEKPDNCVHEVKDDKRVTDILRDAKDWEGLRKFVKEFRSQDLRFVDICDSLIIYIDIDIHLCGSYDELITAERQKKPLFAIVKGGIEKLPTWCFAIFPIEHIFSTTEECILHLSKLNTGEISLDKKWVLIRKYL